MTAADRFKTLIAPLQPETFFKKHWEREFLYIHRDVCDSYDDILTVEDLGRYFDSQTLHPSFLRLVKSGTDCPQEEWTDIERRRNTGFYRVVNNEKLFSLIATGATVIISAAERAIPKLGQFCLGLEKELGIRIQANLYITPPNETGFKVHFDPHDVFILQAAGKKQWRLFGFNGKSHSDQKL